MPNKEYLIEKAKTILYKNWKDGFTIPSERLYPFQWNWDSGFVSIGFSHFNLSYAMEEIRSLFKGQWENGMVPHIIFHSETEKTYFPNYDFWNANVNPGAPQKPKTSGITQPPVHGFVLEKIWEDHPDHPDVEKFIHELFPKVVKLHRFLYTYRDPHQEGLVFIFHPWESGRDNSPIWDHALNNIEIKPEELPAYKRRDITIADPSERPTGHEYDRYVYLLQLGKKHQYDGREIAEESPFLIQDNLFNAILIKSNDSLIRLGKHFGFDTAEVEAWQQKSMARFDEKLWNQTLGTYCGFDLRHNQQLEHKEIGGLIAMFAGVPSPERARLLKDYLDNLSEKGYFLCPSFDIDSPLFDSKRYWRGPVWAHMNWLIYFGLKRYGFDDTANILKEDILTIASKVGYYEYYEPTKELFQHLDHGYGGSDFSWTASSILDLLFES